MTGYTRRREKTEANDCSLCVVFMTEGDYSCVVFHSTVHQVCKQIRTGCDTVLVLELMIVTSLLVHD